MHTKNISMRLKGYVAPNTKFDKLPTSPQLQPCPRRHQPVRAALHMGHIKAAHRHRPRASRKKNMLCHKGNVCLRAFVKCSIAFFVSSTAHSPTHPVERGMACTAKVALQTVRHINCQALQDH